MGRQHQPERLEKLYETVEKHPGEHAGHIAQVLGWQRSEVTRTLPALEEKGYLLSEDEKGRLWPYERDR